MRTIPTPFIDAWQDALEYDNEEKWRDVSLMLHGAVIAGIWSDDEITDDYRLLRRMADDFRLDLVKSTLRAAA